MARSKARFTYHLDRETLRERVRDHTKEGYLLIFNVMKGVALANAAISLGKMINHGVSLGAYILWLASLFALIVSHSTTMTGILLSTSRRNPLDTIIPFALSIEEFLIFSTLNPEDALFSWRAWYLAYGVWSLTSSFLIFNRVLQKDDSEVNARDIPLADLMRTYKKRLLRNLIAACLLAVLSLSVGLLLPNFPSVTPCLHILLGEAVLLAMIAILFQNEADHRSILAVAARDEGDTQSADTTG